MKITRTSQDEYAVVTDRMMSDGTLDADSSMKLVGNQLRSIERPSFIRVGGLMRVTLGAKSLPVVSAMKIGDEVNF